MTALYDDAIVEAAARAIDPDAFETVADPMFSNVPRLIQETIRTRIKRAQRDALAALAITAPMIAANAYRQAAECALAWQRSDKLRLAGGEMTAQELRTAKAVVGVVANAIQSLSPEQQP